MPKRSARKNDQPTAVVYGCRTLIFKIISNEYLVACAPAWSSSIEVMEINMSLLQQFIYWIDFYMSWLVQSTVGPNSSCNHKKEINIHEATPHQLQDWDSGRISKGSGWLRARVTPGAHPTGRGRLEVSRSMVVFWEKLHMWNSYYVQWKLPYRVSTLGARLVGGLPTNCFTKFFCNVLEILHILHDRAARLLNRDMNASA